MAQPDLSLPEFLIHRDGEIRLRGHRVGLYDLVNRYREGYSAEMLALEYPTVDLALIHRVIAFYLENRTAIDAYLDQFAAELHQSERSVPNRIPLEILRERLAATESTGPTASRSGE